MAHLPKAKKRRWNRTTSQRSPSKHRSFYSSHVWTVSSRRFLEKNPICVWYGQRAKCQKKATMTDHIVAITDGGDHMDQSNWQPMCKSCHASKTTQEVFNRRSGMKRKITPNGLR